MLRRHLHHSQHSIRGATSHAGGVREARVINLDDIQTISKELVGKRVTRLSAVRMQEVEMAVKYTLDLK